MRRLALVLGMLLLGGGIGVAQSYGEVWWTGIQHTNGTTPGNPCFLYVSGGDSTANGGKVQCAPYTPPPNPIVPTSVVNLYGQVDATGPIGSPLNTVIDPMGATAGQVLTFNGTAWAPTTSSSGVSSVSGTTAHISATPTTGAVVVDLIATSVTPGSYTYATFTVDADGRLTAANSGTTPVTSIGVAAPITTTGGTTPTIGISLPANRIATGTGTNVTSFADWTWNDASSQLAAGTASPASTSMAHFYRSENADAEYVVANDSTGANALIAFRLTRDAPPAFTDSLLFAQTGTNYLGCAQSGLLACKGAIFELEDAGNFSFSDYGAGDIIFYTTTSRSERLRIVNGGNLQLVNMTAPSTPPSGYLAVWGDTTAKNLFAKNVAGTVNHGTQTFTCSAHQFKTAEADTGASTCTQPAFSDVSGSATCVQLPAFTGAITSVGGTCATSYAGMPASGQIAVGAGATSAPTGSANFTFAGNILTIGDGTTTTYSTMLSSAGNPASFDFYKDVPTTKAVSVGIGVPGGSTTDDLVFASYTGGSWTERGRWLNGSGFQVSDFIGINGASVATNTSFVTGITNNANRDRVQLNVGGGTLGATGTGDNTFVDVIPANTTIRTGVSAGVYATERVRAVTYANPGTSVSLTEASTVYVDNAPSLGGLISSTAYALHVAGGTARFDGSLRATTLSGSGNVIVAADTTGTMGIAGVGGLPPAVSTTLPYYITVAGSTLVTGANVWLATSSSAGAGATAIEYVDPFAASNVNLTIRITTNAITSGTWSVAITRNGSNFSTITLNNVSSGTLTTGTVSVGSPASADRWGVAVGGTGTGMTGNMVFTATLLMAPNVF